MVVDTNDAVNQPSPDLLGVCELENERCGQALLEALGREDYEFASVPDCQVDGFDTGFIFSRDVFELEPASSEQFRRSRPAWRLFPCHTANDHRPSRGTERNFLSPRWQ